MMMAAKHPGLCGPLILAGSPLSYREGVRGVYSMRYTGGMLGGSWLRALAEFKQDLRKQYFMLRLDEERAVAAIPKLLEGHETEWPTTPALIRKIVTAAGPLGEAGQRRLAQLEQLVASGPSATPSGHEPAKTTKQAEVTQ
jgi:hypothetical protein